MSFDNYNFDNAGNEAKPPGEKAPWQKPSQPDSQGGQRQGGYGNSQSNYGGGGGNYNGGNRGAGGGFNRGGGDYNKGGYGGGFRKNDEPEGDPVFYKPYVLSGNYPPPKVMEQLVKIALELQSAGYTMRNRGMQGLEETIEEALTTKEIHLPWKGFGEKDSKHTWTPPAAKELAKRVQPGFDGLKNVVQTFLAANVRMIMGKELRSPALFMITWSEDGAETLKEKSVKTGNAGHAIAVADTLPIPVFNFARPDAESRLRDYLKLTTNQPSPNHVQAQVLEEH